MHPTNHIDIVVIAIILLIAFSLVLKARAKLLLACIVIVLAGMLAMRRYDVLTANMYASYGKKEYWDALDFANRRFTWASSLGPIYRAKQSEALHDIGFVLKDLRRDSLALAYFDRAFSGFTAEHNFAGAAMTLDNMGLLHETREEWDIALSKSKRALENYQKLYGDNHRDVYIARINVSRKLARTGSCGEAATVLAPMVEQSGLDNELQVHATAASALIKVCERDWHKAKELFESKAISLVNAKQQIYLEPYTQTLLELGEFVYARQVLEKALQASIEQNGIRNFQNDGIIECLLKVEIAERKTSQAGSESLIAALATVANPRDDVALWRDLTEVLKAHLESTPVTKIAAYFLYSAQWQLRQIGTLILATQSIGISNEYAFLLADPVGAIADTVFAALQRTNSGNPEMMLKLIADHPPVAGETKVAVRSFLLSLASPESEQLITKLDLVEMKDWSIERLERVSLLEELISAASDEISSAGRNF